MHHFDSGASLRYSYYNRTGLVLRIIEVHDHSLTSQLIVLQVLVVCTLLIDKSCVCKLHDTICRSLDELMIEDPVEQYRKEQGLQMGGLSC